jgi:hypothetical protein
MPTDIFNKPGVVETILEGDVVHVKWAKLHDADAIYGSCNEQLARVKKGEVNWIIIDVSNSEGTPPMECQKWFGEVLFPGYGESESFQGIINVLPHNAITKMGANRWKRTAESDQFSFNVYETDSVDSAMNLISQSVAGTLD